MEIQRKRRTHAFFTGVMRLWKRMLLNQSIEERSLNIVTASLGSGWSVTAAVHEGHDMQTTLMSLPKKASLWTFSCTLNHLFQKMSLMTRNNPLDIPSLFKFGQRPPTSRSDPYLWSIPRRVPISPPAHRARKSRHITAPSQEAP